MTTRISRHIPALGMLVTVVAGCSGGSTDWRDASSMVGETTQVCGPVMSIRHISESWGEATFLNLGADYPDPGRFTLVVWESKRGLDDLLQGEEVCGTGKVSLYKGAVQLELESFSDLRVPAFEEIPDAAIPGPY